MLSGLQPIINTAHVVNGALVLGTSLVLTLRGHCRPSAVRAEPATVGGVAAVRVEADVAGL